MSPFDQYTVTERTPQLSISTSVYVALYTVTGHPELSLAVGKGQLTFSSLEFAGRYRVVLDGQFSNTGGTSSVQRKYGSTSSQLYKQTVVQEVKE